MKIELKDTNSAEILATLQKARNATGSTSAEVLNLLIDLRQPKIGDIEQVVLAPAHEHPSRIIILSVNPNQQEVLNATIERGEDIPGEIIILQLSLIERERIQSIILPLLSPDSPVVAWWPFEAPSSLLESSIGQLASRRIADSSSSKTPFESLMARSRQYHEGDSDLAWGRLTHWRAMLVMALDECQAQVRKASVYAEEGNAPSHLLGSWLRYCLDVPVELITCPGEGLIGVTLSTDIGEIKLTRKDGYSAEYVIPGQPDRRVALKRRDINELITEELRHMGSDPIYGEVINRMLNWHDQQGTHSEH